MRIATRGSDLALWQARWVRDRISALHALHAEFVVLTTKGDRQTQHPIHALEGVGFFTKEIEVALLDGIADVAVHSYKDLPTTETPSLLIAAVPQRAAPNDWLLIHRDQVDQRAAIWPLSSGARVGTCSVRRSAQLLRRRPDLNIADLRGNVPTRVKQLKDGVFDAIVLAQAGLERLGLELSDFEVIDLLPSGFLPAAGQGALAIQCRSDDEAVKTLLKGLHHPPTATSVTAERALSARFSGGCSLALGCLASVVEARVELRACWPKSSDDYRTCTVMASDPESAAQQAYERLTSP